MEAVTAALEASAPALYLRQSWWAYPLLNIAHLLGLASLFGAALAYDLRLLGVFGNHGPREFERSLTAVAAGGLAVALVTGLMLFAVRAGEYAVMPVFWVKLILVAIGSVNAAGMGLTSLGSRVPRLTAAVSLAAWTGAIASGRLIGYWEG